MKYSLQENKILIEDLSQFNIKQILDCGQIFRYEIVGDLAIVISQNRLAVVKTNAKTVEIFTKEVEYFVNFFDLEIDYNLIKKELSKDKFLKPCCEFGYGIRILKQDLFEMIVSFITSANNNIARIKNTLNYLSENFGEKIAIDFEISKIIKQNISNFNSIKLIKENDGNLYYYAFPTLDEFKFITEDDFKKAGLGYRAEQLKSTIEVLNYQNLEQFKKLSLDDKRKFLISLKGVGDKVANCIMLFSEYDVNSFPVDTWINKVYNSISNQPLNDRKQIEKILTSRYKNLSGYAQQYFFYYFRENKIK